MHPSHWLISTQVAILGALHVNGVARLLKDPSGYGEGKAGTWWTDDMIEAGVALKSPTNRLLPRPTLARDREGPLPRTSRPDPDRALPPGDSAPPAELGVRAILPVRHRQQWSPCLLGTAVPRDRYKCRSRRQLADGSLIYYLF